LGCSLKAEVKVAVQGKILNPNKEKGHKLNVVLEKYLKAVKFFASFKINDKDLQQKAYKEARRRFGLSSTLTQTARDKAVELVKANEGREFHVHEVSIRVNYRAFKLVRRDTKLTYWLYLKLDGDGVWYPVQFGETQRQMIVDALSDDSEWSLQQVELKRDGEWYLFHSRKALQGF